MNTDGVFTGPTYKIGETNYYNVGDALAAINSSFSTSLGDALLWDATAGKFSAKHGTNGDASRSLMSQMVKFQTPVLTQ